VRIVIKFLQYWHYARLNGLWNALAVLECDTNYSLPVAVSCADADSTERRAQPLLMTRVIRVMRNIDLFEKELSLYGYSAIRLHSSISRYSIQCDVSCHHYNLLFPLN